LIFVPPRFDTYKAISLRIRDIVAEYTLIIEHLSLDEAYLERSAQSDDRDPVGAGNSARGQPPGFAKAVKRIDPRR